MTAADTGSVDVEEQTEEWGLCPACGKWAWGAFLADLTAYTAAVLHCWPPGPATTEPPRGAAPGPNHPEE